MSKGTGLPLKAIGIALLVLGAGLAFWGFQLSESVGSQVTELVTGSETDRVMMFYIGGAVSFAVGLYLFLKK
ncbi:DUF3185 family protein [Saccharospirillum alexandrii]|uniref:DUF3185 family protein n=1 Tax=Saccharospirillum alexandrii TaxID=2448477 RepID=UPI000FD95CAF|nr:DUF3185 family protein [Saccharospirillum alexandrii]